MTDIFYIWEDLRARAVSTSTVAKGLVTIAKGRRGEIEATIQAADM